jgi:hypothetical protein
MRRAPDRQLARLSNAPSRSPEGSRHLFAAGSGTTPRYLGLSIVHQTRETIHVPQVHPRGFRLRCAFDDRLCSGRWRCRWWRQRRCGWRCQCRCQRRSRNRYRRRGICGELGGRNGHLIQQRQFGAVSPFGDGDACPYHRRQRQHQQEPEQSERSAADCERHVAVSGASCAERWRRPCAQWIADRQPGHRDQQ